MTMYKGFVPSALALVQTLPSCLFLESMFPCCPQRPVKSQPWSKHVCSSWINQCMLHYVFASLFAILLESSCSAAWSATGTLEQMFPLCSLLCIVWLIALWQAYLLQLPHCALPDTYNVAQSGQNLFDPCQFCFLPLAKCDQLRQNHFYFDSAWGTHQSIFFTT